MLAGLEHLDERYVKAVGYATKAKRHGRPKMVLLGDIVGDDDNAVAKAASDVVRIANLRGGEGFIAVSAEARKRFWLDRARTAAIARHTNAFKINEDVVIPLPRLGDYTDGIERINIELSLAQQDPPGRRARAVPRRARCSATRGRPTATLGRRRRSSTRRWSEARALVAGVRAHVAGLARPHRRDVSGAAGPFGRRVVEARAAGAAGGDLRRARRSRRS